MAPIAMTEQTKSSDFETGMWENGTYSFTLKEIRAGMKLDQYGDKPKAQFVFEDEDGDLLESNTINLPKNFAYNNKSTFWEYVGAIHGEVLKETDAVITDIPGVNTWQNALELPRFFTSGERPEQITSITVNGVEVIGNSKKFNITLSKQISEKGNPYNRIMAIAPIGGGGKVKKAAQPSAPQAPL